jgi:hypothetical protein
VSLLWLLPIAALRKGEVRWGPGVFILGQSNPSFIRAGKCTYEIHVLHGTSSVSRREGNSQAKGSNEYEGYLDFISFVTVVDFSLDVR